MYNSVLVIRNKHMSAESLTIIDTTAEQATPTRGERFKAMLKNPELRAAALRIGKIAGSAALEGAGIISTDEKTGRARLERDGVAMAVAAPGEVATMGLAVGLEAGARALVHEGVAAIKNYAHGQVMRLANPAEQMPVAPPTEAMQAAPLPPNLPPRQQ